MAEPVSPDSKLSILGAYTLENCSSFYNEILSIQPKPRKIRNLEKELQALISALTLLTTVYASTDPDLSALKLPLLQCGILCKKAFKHFKQPVPLSSKLTSLDYAIDDFKDFLTGYKLIFNLVYSDTNLREASVINLKIHGELVQNAAQQLLTEHENIEEKFATESGSNTKLRSIQASLEKCLQLLRLFTRRFNQVLSAESERFQQDMKSTLRKPDEGVSFSTISNDTESDSTNIVSNEKVLVHSVSHDTNSDLHLQSKNDDASLGEEKPIQERPQKMQKSSIIRGDLPLVFEQLSEKHKQQRADILSTLHSEPASINLRAYFKRLKKGSLTWDINTFIEGIICFARLYGSERLKYYQNKLGGLHHQHSFVELWNQIYPQLPITAYDQKIRRQCPPSWCSELRGKELHWVLIYQGVKPLSQGLNELVKGPTTMDCGMICQLVLWFGIRYVVGDDWFDKLVKLERGKFILTQGWELPMDDDGTMGNLLSPFYDDPLSTESLKLQTRIWTKTIFNHPKYLAKHPGGVSRLQNVTQIDDYNLIYDPSAPRKILSDTEIEQELQQNYNNPQNFADLERLWLYKQDPDYVHPHFTPKSYRTLAHEAEKLAGHILDDIAWENSKPIRDWNGRGLCLALNVQRLTTCLVESKNACLNGATDGDILSRAKKMKLLDEIKSMAVTANEVESSLSF